MCYFLKKTNKDLESKTKETPLFSLNGKHFDAKIVYIYDGDTMHCVFKVFGEYYRWNCRIWGVDTPEIRTKNEGEKKKGIEVRDILRNKLQDKILTIKCYDFDKYGRLLIDVYIENGTLLSQWLILNNYGYTYNGGTKKR
jgi:micrococcal nuclease